MRQSILIDADKVNHGLLDNWVMDIAEAARKYKTRTEFLRGDGYLYRLAQRVGLLKLVTAHMPRRVSDTKDGQIRRNTGGKIGRPAIELHPDEIREAASHYRTRSEFLANAPTHYRKAREAGILDSVTAHMPRRQFKLNNK